MAIACITRMLVNIAQDTAALYSRKISVDCMEERLKDEMCAAWAQLVVQKDNPEAVSSKLPFLLPLKTASLAENRYTIGLSYRFSRGMSLRSIITHHIQDNSHMDEYMLLYMAHMALADMSAGLQHSVLLGLSPESVLVDRDTGKLIYTVFAPVTLLDGRKANPTEEQGKPACINPINKAEAVLHSITGLGMLLYRTAVLTEESISYRSEHSLNSSKDVTLVVNHTAIASEMHDSGYSKQTTDFVMQCVAAKASSPDSEGSSLTHTFEGASKAVSRLLKMASGDAADSAKTSIESGTKGNPESNSEELPANTTAVNLLPVELSAIQQDTAEASSQKAEELDRSRIENLIRTKNVEALAACLSSTLGASLLSSFLETSILAAKKQYSDSLETIVRACAANHKSCLRISARTPETSPVQTYLITAAQDGNVEGIKKNYPELGFMHGKYTALMEAARRNNIQAVKLLLGELGYVNAIGQTALMLATYFNNTDVVRFLLMETGIADKWGTTALMIACAKGNDNIARLLLQESRYQDEWGCTALIYAAQHGHLRCVNILKEVELNMCTRISTTALSHAMMCGNMHCAVALQAEAPKSNVTPLMMHAFFNTLGDNPIQRINEYIATVYYANKAGFTAIMFAAAGHNWPVVDILLEHEAKVSPDLRIESVRDAAFNSIAHVIQVKNVHLTFVFAKYIHYCLMDNTDSRDKHAPSDFQDRYGRIGLRVWEGISSPQKTALMEYTRQGDVIGVRAAKDDYCKVFDGHTALMLAVLNKMTICSFLLLLEMGIQGAGGKTALMHSVESGQVDMVYLLLAEAPIRDATGQTALDIARRAAKKHKQNAAYGTCLDILSKLSG